MTLGEDRHTARSDQQPEDDQHDPVEDRAAHQGDDAADHQDHGEQPQQERHGDGLPHCFACDTVLTPDNAVPDTDYAFDNALWIGFFGGYGMFVDNVEQKLPTNTDERWLRNSDERDDWGMYCDFKLGTDCNCYVRDRIGAAQAANVEMEYHELKCPCRNPVDDPDYEPKYDEERMLPGRPDYEVVICHDCAHALWDAVPWLTKIIPARFSHSHKTPYLESHPDHDCHEHHSRECNDHHIAGRLHRVTCLCR